jgi:23S rRNA pseudouridine1911/1915/1917 synthase
MEDLEILYEDNHIIVVHKPQGVPSQADSTGDEDMLSMVKKYIKDKYNKPGNVFVGLVHRLDRPTGGVMVFAKNSKSAARLSEQIQNGEMTKTYFAVCCGGPTNSSGTLVNYLKKDEALNKVSIVPQTVEGAKRAELRYSVLARTNDYSLLKINLVTGRGHQIRAQLANIKCPIVGDQKYGGVQKVMLNLYAVQLSFYHPTTKQKLVFRVYPPEDAIAWNNFKLENYLGLK